MDNNDRAESIDRRYPPGRTWIRETADNIVIGAIETNLSGVFVLLFLGIPLVFVAIAVNFLTNDRISAINVIVGLILFLFGCGFTYFGLSLLAGEKIEIVIGKESYIKRSLVLNIQRDQATKETFNWDSVVKIEEDFIKLPRSRLSNRRAFKEPFITIKTQEKTILNKNGKKTDRIVFGHNLTKKQRSFILNKLQEYHHQQ